MTSAELAEAKRYGRLGLFCSLADKLINVVYLTAAVLFLAGPIDGWLQGYPLLHRNWSLRLVALFLGVTVVHVVVSFPLSLYSGHIWSTSSI